MHFGQKQSKTFMLQTFNDFWIKTEKIIPCTYCGRKVQYIYRKYVIESGGGLASNFLEVASKQSKICREERFWRDEVADKVLYSSSLESLLPFTTRADRPYRTQIVAVFKKQKS